MTKNQTQLYLINSQHEFFNLLIQLGYSDFDADIKAFFMTKNLAVYIKQMTILKNFTTT